MGFGSDLNIKAKLKKNPGNTNLSWRNSKENAWGAVSLVCIHIGHACTLLAETADHLALAMARRRPCAGGLAQAA